MSVLSCRLCAQTTSNNLQLFSLDEDNSFCKIVEKHTFIKIDPDDHLSHNVCGVCKETVKNWHDFWLKCRETQKSFNTYISDSDVSDGNPNAVHETFEVTKTNIQPTLPIIISRPSTEQKTRSCYCIAEWCNNNNATSSMFRVPKDKTRGDQWLTNSGRKDLLNLDLKKRTSLYLCGKHFTDEMFSNCKKEKLNRNAIPSIFPQPRRIKKNNSSHGELSQENSDSILQQEMIAVAGGDGKFRRILPKYREENKLVSNYIVANNSPNDSEQNISVKINSNYMSFIDDKDVVFSKDSTSPSVVCKVPEQNKRRYQTSMSNTAKRRAVNIVSKKAMNEVILSGQTEEDSSMTCEDSYFPASSLLVFPESVHRCTFCGEVFAIKNSLSNHLKTYHS